MRKVYKNQRLPITEGRLQIEGNTQKDPEGRWIVRADSRVLGFDTVFAGAGDTFSPMEMGGGTDFRFDFSDANQLIDNPPAGHRRIHVDWNFNDFIYLKEGTIYYSNAPKGSWIDFQIICPAGQPYNRKVYGTDPVLDNFQIASEDMVVSKYIVKYWAEGNIMIGDELNTEAASGTRIPPVYIWRAIITVPEVTGWQDFHGHWNLEIYRPSSVYFGS